jgi:hypothetical protein
MNAQLGGQMTLKQLEKKIAAVEKRVAKLEKTKKRTTTRKQNGARKTNGQRTRQSSPSAGSEQARQKHALESLREKGMIVELPPEAKKRAARWRALPQDERKRILNEFSQVRLDKPLSEIIIQNRH